VGTTMKLVVERYAEIPGPAAVRRRPLRVVNRPDHGEGAEGRSADGSGAEGPRRRQDADYLHYMNPA